MSSSVERDILIITQASCEKMSNSPSSPNDPTEVVLSDLRTFVNSAFDTYKSMISKFGAVATSALTEVEKTQQAAIHLSDVASVLASKYLGSKTGTISREILEYNIMGTMLSDGRVMKALGLSGNAWDQITALPQLVEASAYAVFVGVIRARDSLRKEMSTCCC